MGVFSHFPVQQYCDSIFFLTLHMLHPDEIKQKVEAKFNELGDMCEGRDGT